MTDPAIIEAAAREYGRQLSVINVAAQTLKDAADLSAFWDDEVETRRVAQAVLAAVTPLILARERKEVSEQARRYAGHYQEGSDGRNTFVMLAEWIEARALKDQP